jgi:hypothetical protein
LSPQNQGWIADYLTHLRTRHYALSTQDGALRALKCFAVLMPEARQALLYQDLTQTTPADNELPRSKLRGINPPLADSYGPPVWRGKAGVSCVGSACEP